MRPPKPSKLRKIKTLRAATDSDPARPSAKNKPSADDTPRALANPPQKPLSRARFKIIKKTGPMAQAPKAPNIKDFSMTFNISSNSSLIDFWL